MSNHISSWRNWGDHPTVVGILIIGSIIGSIFGCIGIFSFFTGKETLQQVIIGNPTASSEQVAIILESTHTPVWSTETVSSVIEEPEKLNCYSSPYIDLGNKRSSSPIFLPNNDYQSAVFTHCPPYTSIQYISIAIDDHLEQVEMVCEDENENLILSDSFHEFDIENEELIHWKSDWIVLKQNCRLDFTIEDIEGVNIGMQIKDSRSQ